VMMIIDNLQKDAGEYGLTADIGSVI
jgi:hypothetical protein